MKEFGKDELHRMAVDKVAPFVLKLHAIKYPERHDKYFSFTAHNERIWLPSLATVELDPTTTIRQKAHDIAPEFQPIGRHIAATYAVRRAAHLHEFLDIHSESVVDDMNQLVDLPDILPTSDTLEDMITQLGERNRGTCKSLEEHIGYLMLSHA